MPRCSPTATDQRWRVAVLPSFAVGRRASRDRLVDLLWSYTDREQARRTPRQTVWLIRQRLGNDALAGERDELSLCIDLGSDRDEFLAALSAGELEQALRIDEVRAQAVGFRRLFVPLPLTPSPCRERGNQLREPASHRG